MRYDLTDDFLDQAYSLPKEIGRKIWKAIGMLSRNPEWPGLNLERLRGKSEGLWSLRVDDKYRAILSRSPQTINLLSVGHKEDVYRLAERLSLQRPAHPERTAEFTPGATDRGLPGTKPAPQLHSARL